MTYNNILKRLVIGIFSFPALFLPATAVAAATTYDRLDLTAHPVGLLTIILFVIAYLMVICEECTNLRKSKPVILAAGLIWGLIAYQYSTVGLSETVVSAFRHFLLEFSELFLFLLVAMTYVNAMDERQVFMALRSWLVRRASATVRCSGLPVDCLSCCLP